MSFRAVTWAFDRVRGLTATEKLVLLALAEFANDEDQTWRSRQVIAQRAECSVSAVEKTLRTLKTAGLVSLSHRYSWCEQTADACKDRAPHKHRSGTTYTLHLEVTVIEPRATRSWSARTPRSAGSTAEAGSENPTPVKFTGVGESPDQSGNSHNRKIYGYGEKQGSTPVKIDPPQPYVREAIYKIDPPIKPPTKPNHSSESYDRNGSVLGSVRDGVEDLDSTPSPVPPSRAVPPAPASPASSAAPKMDDDSLLEAAGLAARCLPASMSALDPAGLASVAQLLRERLDAGWLPHEIKARVDQPLPPTVSRLSALVASRITKNVLVGLSPARVAEQAAQARVGAQPVVEAPAPVDPRLKDVWAQVERDNPGLRKLEIAAKVEEILAYEGAGAR